MHITVTRGAATYDIQMDATEFVTIALLIKHMREQGPLPQGIDPKALAGLQLQFEGHIDD